MPIKPSAKNRFKYFMLFSWFLCMAKFNKQKMKWENTVEAEQSFNDIGYEWNLRIEEN